MARVVTIIPAGVLGFAFGGAMLAGDALRPVDLAIGASATALLFIAAIRSLTLGVWFEPDRVVARTWLRTVRIPRDEIASCITVAYWGALTEGWRVQYLRELQIGTTRFETYTLGGTVAFSRTSNRQRAEILAYRRIE